MESCNICCFPYSDNLSEGTSHRRKDLDCNHSLCKNCYLRLEKTHCPFCRSVFNYTKDELDERKLLNLNYNQWQPPSQISNYIPPDTYISRRRNRHRNVTLPNVDLVSIRNNDSNIIESLVQEPFRRVRKNMMRNKRRNLDFGEILERRRIIKKRCNTKWNRKNARVDKEISYFTAGMCVN